MSRQKEVLTLIPEVKTPTQNLEKSLRKNLLSCNRLLKKNKLNSVQEGKLFQFGESSF
jgi:hypothetical protein